MTGSPAAAGQRVRGAILAGGGATRFGGRPKGLERVAGERILDRLVREFERALGEPPILVANDPAAPAWRPGLAVVSDRRPGLGSLGGLLTAVREAPAPVVCVAWDMPFVTAPLIRALAAGLAGYDAYLPARGGGGEWGAGGVGGAGEGRGLEPLCAAYGPAAGPAIARSLAAGDRRAISFHAEVRVGILSEADVRRFGDPDRLFFNVNTAVDLARAQELG